MSSIIITGAANGIGNGLVAHYANTYHVHAIDLDAPGLNALLKTMPSDSKGITTYVCDVTDLDAFSQTLDQIFKDHPVTLLINNVGVGANTDFLNLTPQDFERIYRINVTSIMMTSQAFARHCITHSQKGAIVNLASTRALMSEPNTESYSASKGAVVALTHSLALSLGPYGIRVNCISPGWIHHQDTPLTTDDHAQHPCGRVGHVADVVRACAFLTAPENDFVTGHNLVVDGGMTKKMIYV